MNGNTKCFERVDLLIALHRGQVCGVCTTGPARHHNSRHDRCHLPCHADTDKIGDIYSRTEPAKLYRANKGDDGAYQPVHHGDDTECGSSCLTHLLENVGAAGPRAFEYCSTAAECRLPNQYNDLCSL